MRPSCRDADREGAVGAEELAGGEAARRARRRAVHVVQQPLVGAERPVEPHHVVEARHHEPGVVLAEGMRQRGGAEEREVGRVRDDARVKERVVGQPAPGAQPCVLIGIAHRVAAVLTRRAPGLAHRTEVERVHDVGHALAVDRLEVDVGEAARPRHRLGGGDVGHLVGVLVPRLGHVERRGQVEDRLAMLDGDDPTRGKAAAVADAVDVVHHRHLRIAEAQEVGVHRVHVTLGVDGAAGGHQRLREHLAAVEAHALAVEALAAEQVHFERLEIEQGHQVVEGAHRSKLPARRITRRRPRPRRAGLGRPS